MINMFSPEMLSALISSFGISLVVLLTQRWHSRLTGDHDLHGAQKIHQTPVPRVGGLGVAIGLCTGTLIAFLLGDQEYRLMATLLLCATPVFMAGFGEDLTKRISVRMRLNASFASAGLAIWIMGAELTRLNTSGLDTLIAFSPISVLFTCFAVGGMTHAINIIDGLNGLASGCVVLMLSGLAAIAWQAGDTQVMNMCLWGVAATIGFLCLNFPFGRIFLGDGGAYLIGFWLAECAVLLLNRNPEVSTWAVLLCCVYPVWETLFSAYRRRFRQRVSSGSPDMVHMHHLVYRYFVQRNRQHRSKAWQVHALSTLFIWASMAACPLVAVICYQNSSLAMLATAAFVVLYSSTYRTLQGAARVITPAALPLGSDVQ